MISFFFKYFFERFYLDKKGTADFILMARRLPVLEYNHFEATEKRM